MARNNKVPMDELLTEGQAAFDRENKKLELLQLLGAVRDAQRRDRIERELMNLYGLEEKA